MKEDIKALFAQRATEAGGRLTVKSALNPVLWLCAIVSVPAVVIASWLSNPPWWLLILVLGPVTVAMFGYLFLLCVDRDKLQSEDFQIRKRTLELIEQKGMDGPITATALEMVSPPLVLTGSERERDV